MLSPEEVWVVILSIHEGLSFPAFLSLEISLGEGGMAAEKEALF